MQDGSLDADRDVQGISGETCKDYEQGGSGGGYETRRKKNRVTIPNNPECLSRILGDECGNNYKGESDGVVG